MTKVKFVVTFSGFLFQQLEVQSSEIAGDHSLWVSNIAAISHFAVYGTQLSADLKCFSFMKYFSQESHTTQVQEVKLMLLMNSWLLAIKFSTKYLLNIPSSTLKTMVVLTESWTGRDQSKSM